MRKTRIGDYILGKNQEVYRIIDVYENTADNITLYDIKSLTEMDKRLEFDGIPASFKCLNSKGLKRFGRVIAEEEATEMLELLYGKEKDISWGLRTTK